MPHNNFMVSQILDSKGRQIKATIAVANAILGLGLQFEPIGRKTPITDETKRDFNHAEQPYKAGPILIKTYNGTEVPCYVLVVKDNRGKITQGPYAIPLKDSVANSVKKQD